MPHAYTSSELRSLQKYIIPWLSQQVSRVPRSISSSPLPERIQPGTTLDCEDYMRIRILLARGVEDLQRLCNNFSDLGAPNEDLIEQPDRAMKMVREFDCGYGSEWLATVCRAGAGLRTQMTLVRLAAHRIMGYAR